VPDKRLLVSKATSEPSPGPVAKKRPSSGSNWKLKEGVCLVQTGWQKNTKRLSHWDEELMPTVWWCVMQIAMLHQESQCSRPLNSKYISYFFLWFTEWPQNVIKQQKRKVSFPCSSQCTFWINKLVFCFFLTWQDLGTQPAIMAANSNFLMKLKFRTIVLKQRLSYVYILHSCKRTIFQLQFSLSTSVYKNPIFYWADMF